VSRADGRRPDRLRSIEIEPDYLEQPHGCALITVGKTKVLCTAMIQEEVPRWLRNQGRGWMTAEYSLLPASTGDRVDREAARGKLQGRTVEIQRLIGRAVRAVVDFQALGERTMWLDCDVLQADGGTRCAAISGAYVAARRALDRFGLTKAFVDSVAAVSVGVVDGVPLLDLDYSEDSNADTDMNVVMTGDGRLIEVQATAEKDPFTRARLDELLALAEAGIAEIANLQAVELERLMPGWTIVPLDRDDYPPETGATYADNARGKARFGARGDAWSLGEDSGVEVDALGGRPGIESARYAPEGAPAIAKLLGELDGVPSDRRRARYVSELVAIAPDGEELRGTGTLDGRIVAEPRGAEGFGYDPIFVPDGEERTVAELGDDWKAANSHRARAVRALLEAVDAAGS
jgi:ribonuclease PH